MAAAGMTISTARKNENDFAISGINSVIVAKSIGIFT
jgi:hypothetical protein